MFVVVVYYLEVGDVGLWVVVANAAFVNCSGDMTIVLFYSIFKTSAGYSYVRQFAIFFWPGLFVHYALF